MTPAAPAPDPARDPVQELWEVFPAFVEGRDDTSKESIITVLTFQLQLRGVSIRESIRVGNELRRSCGLPVPGGGEEEARGGE